MIDEEAIIENLKNVHDPEIPWVGVYDLGLIYDIDIDNKLSWVTITHTLTSAFCPFADKIATDIKMAGFVEGVEGVSINLTFEPPFSRDMVPIDTKLLLGWF